MKYCPLCGREYAEGDVCPGDGAVLVATQQQTDPLIGQVLKDTYRIEEQIGAGGMGAVFRAEQRPLGRDVAVKVLLPSSQSTPSLISRFFQEAKLLSQLSHPNVVGIIDFGNTESGMIFMVMEYLQGRTLNELVPKGKGLPLAEAAHWMRQACAGVGAAHTCDLVHRDLKPENLFIASSRGAPDTLKVLDFGIARALEGDDRTRLTQAGLLMGTPGFIAPEQIESPAEAGARSDIYALGAILYFMATGSRPYHGQTPHSILVQQMQKAPQLDLGLLAEHPELAAVVGRAMNIDPAERFASTAELAAALDAVVGASAPAALSSVTGTGPAPSGSAADSLPPTVLAIKDGPDRKASGGGRLRVLLPVLVALALVVGGAAWWWISRDGAASGAGSASGEASAAPGVTDSRITVGMSAAFSGPSKELGRGMQTGIETSFREVNEAGGIHGRELHLVALDDAYEPDRAVTNMIDLVLERRVFAVIGNVGTPTAAVTVPLALEHQVPFIGAFTGAELLRREPPDRYVFNYRASYAEETASIVHHFVDGRGIDPARIAVFAQEDGFGDAGYEGVVAALAERGYSGPTLRVGYRRNSLDVESAVERLVARGADIEGVVLVATYRAAAELIRQVVDAGLTPVFANLSFVGSQALAEELSELGSEYAEGVIVAQVVPLPGSPAPGVVRYRESLQRHFPAEQPGFVSLEGFLVGELFAESLRRAGEQPTVEGLVDAMQAIDRLDLGIGSNLGFGPERHQASSTVWGTVLDENGQYVELDL